MSRVARIIAPRPAIIQSGGNRLVRGEQRCCTHADDEECLQLEFSHPGHSILRNVAATLVERSDQSQCDTVARAEFPMFESTGLGAATSTLNLESWAFRPDGAIGLVSARPYQVTIFKNGKTILGPEIPFAAVVISEKQKQEWREQGQRLRLALLKRPGRHDTLELVRPAYNEPRVWPLSLPPFKANELRFDSEGNLWVQKHRTDNDAAAFDIIDADARPIASVVLRSAGRLVGFGNGTVYAVAHASADSILVYRLSKERLSNR